MSWSIHQVSEMSGLTARALRYYDEIGLLRPVRTGNNGYRFYDRAQLLRLQQILLLRSMDVDLATIGAVLDAQEEPLAALRRHHRRLLDERGRLDRLAATVAATIRHLEEGRDMPAENLFKGFELSPEYITAFERQVVEATGNPEQPEIAEMKRRTAEWSSDDFSSFNDRGARLERRLLALLDEGVAPDDTATLDLLDEDLALQREIWTPDKPGYIALAHSLREPSEWRAHLDALDKRLAEYLRQAMLAYADQRLNSS